MLVKLNLILDLFLMVRKERNFIISKLGQTVFSVTEFQRYHPGLSLCCTKNQEIYVIGRIALNKTMRG